MIVRIIAFTDTGEALAARLTAGLQGEVMRCGQPLSLDEWTREGFAAADALVYVGAAGIAVRAIAPYVASKVSDPAVVVVDETAQYAIALLGGHLGGANALARRVAALCGAAPVITTATDCHGVFAVDSWARAQGCMVANPEGIRVISSRLLAGETIRVRSDWEIAGDVPAGIVACGDAAAVAESRYAIGGAALNGASCDVHVSLMPDPQATLRIVPQIAVLGIGCKKGTEAAAIERMLKRVCNEAPLDVRAVCCVCSIDCKAAEPGLVQFCEGHGWTLETYPAEALRAVPGTFAGSAFVADTVGVDNVCERSAVLGSDGGALHVHKCAADGVTMAVALRAFRPDWRWQDA